MFIPVPVVMLTFTDLGSVAAVGDWSGDCMNQVSHRRMAGLWMVGRFGMLETPNRGRVQASFQDAIGRAGRCPASKLAGYCHRSLRDQHCLETSVIQVSGGGLAETAQAPVKS